MKHPPFKVIVLIRQLAETVSDGQFKWGTCLLKSNGGVHQGWLVTDGHRDDSVKVKASFTARRMCRAVAKAGLSEPTLNENLNTEIWYSSSHARRSGEDHQIKATPGITG